MNLSKTAAVAAVIFLATVATPSVSQAKGGFAKLGFKGGGSSGTAFSAKTFKFNGVPFGSVSGADLATTFTGKVSEFATKATTGTPKEQALAVQKYQLYRQRTAAASERAHELRVARAQEQARRRALYSYDIGYVKEPAKRDYNFVDTSHGLVTGVNLLRHINRTLGR